MEQLYAVHQRHYRRHHRQPAPAGKSVANGYLDIWHVSVKCTTLVAVVVALALFEKTKANAFGWTMDVFILFTVHDSFVNNLIRIQNQRRRIRCDAVSHMRPNQPSTASQRCRFEPKLRVL